MNFSGYFGGAHQSQIKQTNFKYSVKQMSVMTISLLTAGIGFLGTFLIGFLCQYLLSLSSNGIAESTLYTVSSIGILVGSILAIIWCFRVYKASTGFAIATILTYCISFGIGFGFLFYAIDFKSILFAFGVVGLIFLGTFIISKIISFKVALSLAKILIVSAIVAIVVILVSNLVVFYTNIFSSFETSIQTARITILITTIVSGLLSIGYLAWNLWLAQNMDQFAGDANLSKKIGMFIGFQILVNLIQLVMLILRLFLIFGSSNR